MSDSSRTQLRYIVETTWGVVPASALTDLRFTTESLKHATTVARSSEIRSDRQIPDIIRTQIEAQGGFDFELSYATFDDIIANMMMSTWSAALTISAITISASTTDDSYNDTANGLGAIQVGQWIKVGGFVNSANNGWKRVLTVTAAKVTVAENLVTELAGPTVTINGSMIRNGTTKKSVTLEKEFADQTEFVSFSGMRGNTMALSISPGNIITGSFGFLGQKGIPAGATVGTGAANAAPTNDVMNAIDNVLAVEEPLTTTTTEDVNEITVSMNNNLRGKPEVGTLGNTDIGTGTVNLTGTFNAYFASRTLFQKYTDFTATSLKFQLKDGAGNVYVVTLPSIKLTDGDVVAGGQDQDVIMALSYEARRDPITDAMIQIDRAAGP